MVFLYVINSLESVHAKIMIPTGPDLDLSDLVHPFALSDHNRKRRSIRV